MRRLYHSKRQRFFLRLSYCCIYTYSYTGERNSRRRAKATRFQNEGVEIECQHMKNRPTVQYPTRKWDTFNGPYHIHFFLSPPDPHPLYYTGEGSSSSSSRREFPQFLPERARAREISSPRRKKTLDTHERCRDQKTTSRPSTALCARDSIGQAAAAAAAGDSSSASSSPPCLMYLVFAPPLSARYCRDEEEEEEEDSCCCCTSGACAEIAWRAQREEKADR